jgi:hypothetical protein
VSVLEGGYGREMDESDDEDEGGRKKNEGGMRGRKKREPKSEPKEEAKEDLKGATAIDVVGESEEGGAGGVAGAVKEEEMEDVEDAEDARAEQRMAGTVDEEGWELASLLDGAKSHCGALRDGARPLDDLHFDSFIEAGYPLLDAVCNRQESRVLEILQDRTDDINARCPVAVKGWARGTSVLHAACTIDGADEDGNAASTTSFVFSPVPPYLPQR